MSLANIGMQLTIRHRLLPTGLVEMVRVADVKPFDMLTRTGEMVSSICFSPGSGERTLILGDAYEITEQPGDKKSIEWEDAREHVLPDDVMLEICRHRQIQVTPEEWEAARRDAAELAGRLRP